MARAIAAALFPPLLVVEPPRRVAVGASLGGERPACTLAAASALRAHLALAWGKSEPARSWMRSEIALAVDSPSWHTDSLHYSLLGGLLGGESGGRSIGSPRAAGGQARW